MNEWLAFGYAVAVGVGCLATIGGVTAAFWALADAAGVTR
jgi:hypothetical protein